jgi:hypothetical protein
MENILGLIVTAIVAAVGVIKFRLIEEFVKKITSNDQKAKGYAVLLLVFSLIVIFTIVQQSSSNVEVAERLEPGDANEIADVENEQQEEKTAPKTELEVKVAAAQEGIVLTEKLVEQAKKNKRIKDSTFIASRKERWAYRIGDWTGDDEKILDTHERMMSVGNLKVIKQKRKFLLVKEDYKTKEELEALLPVLRSELQGLSIDVIDLNQFLTRKDDNFIVRNETFRKKRKRIQMECLEAD